MKYIRKIFWLVFVVIFIASVIIGLGVIFAVKNVNVSLESFSYGEWESMDDAGRSEAAEEIGSFKESVLKKYRGKLIGFVNQAELEECFGGSDFALVRFEKEFPCTLNITLKERRETFVISAPDGYRVYDSDGNFLHMKETAENKLDGAPNISVTVSEAEQIKEVAEVSKYFSEYFSALRATVESIEIQKTLTDNMVFHLRCGLSVRIVDYTNFAKSKMQTAYSEFTTLSGEQKLAGTIRATVSDKDGSVIAEYVPD